jgi:hypothetical protein
LPEPTDDTNGPSRSSRSHYQQAAIDRLALERVLVETKYLAMRSVRRSAEKPKRTRLRHIQRSAPQSTTETPVTPPHSPAQSAVIEPSAIASNPDETPLVTTQENPPATQSRSDIIEEQEVPPIALSDPANPPRSPPVRGLFSSLRRLITPLLQRSKAAINTGV